MQQDQKGDVTALGVKGVFEVTCLDKDGNVKWRDTAHNAATTEGLTDNLQLYFNNGTTATTWFIGLIDLTGYTALAAGDTAAQIGGSNGWAEYTNYSGTRKEWTSGTAAAGSLTNASTVDFTMTTSSGTVKGIFLASATSGTTGKLWATALFSSGDQAVNVSDVLQVTYTVNAAAA